MWPAAGTLALPSLGPGGCLGCGACGHLQHLQVHGRAGTAWLLDWTFSSRHHRPICPTAKDARQTEPSLAQGPWAFVETGLGPTRARHAQPGRWNGAAGGWRVAFGSGMDRPGPGLWGGESTVPAPITEKCRE